MHQQSYADTTKMDNTPQEEIPQITMLQPGITIASIVAASGWGWIPPDGSGDFAAPIWGMLLGRDEKTIRRWVSAGDVQARHLGGKQLYIPPESMRAAYPLQ